MSSVSLDKFAEQINALRDQAIQAGGPEAASRIQVYIPTTAGTPDTTYPELTNFQGAHLHQTGESEKGGGQHSSMPQSANWPECVILQ